MTVKELIVILLEYPMDAEISLSIGVEDATVSSFKYADIQVCEERAYNKPWIPCVVRIHSYGESDEDE